MTPNLSAFLSMLAQCEVGTTGPDGYHVLYGGGRFDSFDDHPRTAITAGGYTSTAAGRYQILKGTWDDFVKAEGPHRFDEDGQNLCARWLIARRGATADVEGGRLRAAISKCGKEWASLPGSPYGQPVRTLDYCERVFAANGGVQIDGNTVYQQPVQPVPIETRPIRPKPIEVKNMGAVLAALIPTVLQLFSGRAAAAVQKVSGAPPDIASQFISDMGNKLVGLSGVAVTDDASALKAVAAVVDDPAKMQALQDHAIEYLDKVGPFLDKLAALEQAEWAAGEASMKAASDRNAASKDTPLKQDRAFILAAAIIALVAFVVLSVLWKDAIAAVFGLKDIIGFSTDMQSFVIGAIVGGALTAVISYFLGSNKQSAVKDAAIETLSRATKGA